MPVYGYGLQKKRLKEHELKFLPKDLLLGEHQ